MINLNLQPAVPGHINQTNEAQPGRRIATKEEFVRELNEGRSNFSGMDLQGVRLCGLNLTGCDFSDAKLQKCGFTSVRLDRVNFSGADLTGASVFGCKATGFTMENACLEELSVLDNTFISCRFSNANLSRAYISKSAFHDCEFVRANLTFTTFRQNTFLGADFSRVSTEGKGDVVDCIFRKVSWQDGATYMHFWNVEFEDVNFRGVSLLDVQFGFCHFRGPIDFECCWNFDDISNCTFENVNFLSLTKAPAAWGRVSGFEKERIHYERYRPIWASVIRWERKYDHDRTPVLDLAAYAEQILDLDPVTRKFLREKVASILKERPELATTEALDLFHEIQMIDDEMTEAEIQENKRASEKRERVLSSSSSGSKNSDLVPENVSSWSLNSTRSSITSGSKTKNGNASSGTDTANFLQLFG